MEKYFAKLKNLKPWQWGAIAIVSLLGIWTMFRKQTTVESVPIASAENVPSGGTPGASGGDISGYIDQINTVLDSQNKKIEEVSNKFVERDDSLNLVLEKQNNVIADSINRIQQQSSNQSSAINNAVSSFNSPTSQSNNVIQEVSRAFETQNKNSSSPTIISSTPKVTETIGALNQVIRTVTTPTETKTYNLGNNGVGYNESVSNKFEASLKTDKTAYNIEMARVNQVIADRKAQGLDTTAQEAYKKKILQ